jgi:transposase InsO family protein
MGHPGGHKECEACRLGKQTRQPFSKKRERTDTVGEELSADVVGPISPASLGGSRYFLTVVDTASRYAWIRILKVKSQAEDELKKVVNQVENKLERKVKRIITDGGGEFVNQSMAQWLGDKGISHLITTRNTPQNNGTAERMNRTIMEKPGRSGLMLKYQNTYGQNWCQQLSFCITEIRRLIPS